MSSGTDNVNFWTNEWYNALCGNINTSYIGDLIKCGYDGVFYRRNGKRRLNIPYIKNFHAF